MRTRIRNLRTSVRTFSLTRRGIGFALAAVVTFLLAPILSAPAFLYATGLLLGLLLLGGAFVAAGHSKVRIDRTFTPQVVDPGQSVRARLVVSNTSSIPCPEAVWSDHLPYLVAGEADGVLPALGPSGSSDARISATYTLSSSTRGVHAVGPLRIRVLDPFGLVERNRVFGEPHHLTVLPRRYELPAIRPRGSNEDGATRPAPNQIGVGDDDVIARAYLPGDALKRLHWKATARRGELMVRQEEQQMNPRAAVVLDLDASSHGTSRDRGGAWEYAAGFEWSIAASASIISHLVRAGYVVAVGSTDGSLDAVLSEGQHSVREVMIELARAEPSTRDLWRTPPERATFVITGGLDADRARQWVDAMKSAGSVHAMVSTSTRQAARDVLEGAGWHVVTYTPQSNIPDAWRDLDGTRTHVAR